MGSVIAVSMFKDEHDVAPHVVRHLLEELVDVVIVADNASTDGTRDLLEDVRREHPGHVLIKDDPDVGFRQSDKMTRLAHEAGDQGATFVIPFDADELWLAPDHVGTWLRNMDPGIRVVSADLYNHHPTAADPAGDNPFETIVWRMVEPGALAKVAFRYEPGVVVEMGNHAVTFRDGVPGVMGGGLSIRHFSHRSPEQFRRKVVNGAAAYAATDLPYTYGAHWRSYAQILENGGEEALLGVFNRWFWHASPVDEGLIHDPPPFRRWGRVGGSETDDGGV